MIETILPWLGVILSIVLILDARKSCRQIRGSMQLNEALDRATKALKENQGSRHG